MGRWKGTEIPVYINSIVDHEAGTSVYSSINLRKGYQRVSLFIQNYKQN